MERYVVPLQPVAPGEYVDRAIENEAFLMRKLIRMMATNPRPMPEKLMPLAEYLAEKMDLSLQAHDNGDAEQKSAAFIRGMQWGLGVCMCTDIGNQALMHLADRRDERARRIKVADFCAGVHDYVRTSKSAAWTAQECAPFIDPLDEFPNMTQWGFVSGLYMVGMGEHNKDVLKLMQREAYQRAEYDASFAHISDMENLQEQEACNDLLLELRCDADFSRVIGRLLELEAGASE